MRKGSLGHSDRFRVFARSGDAHLLDGLMINGDDTQRLVVKELEGLPNVIRIQRFVRECIEDAALNGFLDPVGTDADRTSIIYP
jgi:hypothetical protein